MEIEAVIAAADTADAKGVIYPAETLRGMADGKKYFWDEARQVLLYRGELPTGSTKGLKVWKCACGRMNPWAVMECWECKCGRDSQSDFNGKGD